MIFITVGTQFPFDRLIKSVDEWAHDNPDVEIFGQIGNGDYIPKNFSYTEDLSPEDFNSYFSQAELIVAHAGMGTIISSLLDSKPVIAFPRDSDLGEHRNQHQKSTCVRFSTLEGFYVATDLTELQKLLNNRNDLAGGTINKNNIDFINNLEMSINGLLK